MSRQDGLWQQQHVHHAQIKAQTLKAIQQMGLILLQWSIIGHVVFKLPLLL